jgi:hypothetical protein
MKDTSSEDALKELQEWKGIEFTYIAKTTNAVFQVLRSTLTAHGSALWLEGRRKSPNGPGRLQDRIEDHIAHSGRGSNGIALR